jgi:GH18 family chitinase
LPESDPNSRPRDDSDGPNFVLAAQEIRTKLDALGEKLKKPMTLSIAVPARPADLLAYNQTTTTKGLDAVVDYWNLMVRGH